MKAILVIDVDANEIPKDAYANIYVFGKHKDDSIDDFIAYKGDVPLKPMPEKRVPDGNETDEIYGCYVGWNACLEEIEK